MKKIYHRFIKSLTKKILNIYLNIKNKDIKKTIKAVVFNSFKDQKYFLSTNDSVIYITFTDNISKNLFLHNTWNVHILYRGMKVIGKNFKKKTLINVGAHIGSTCIPAVKNHFKNAIAFEPVKNNFRLLTSNVYLNELENKIKLYNIGLSDKKKLLNLKVHGKNTGDYRVANANQNEIEKVECDKLDNYTKNFNKKNSVIFMYAQGHEPDVLMGGIETIKKKIPIITVFPPSLFAPNWFKKYSKLFKYYNYFYDLQSSKNLRKEFNKAELIRLYDKYNVGDDFTDILII